MIAAAPLSGPPRETRVRSFAALRAVICRRGAFEVMLIQAERPPDVSGVFPFVVQRKGTGDFSAKAPSPIGSSDEPAAV
jgi:hypothetical protein